MKFDWYKFLVQVKNYILGRPTIVVDDTGDFCMVVGEEDCSLSNIFRLLRNDEWQINYPLQHRIKTIYGMQLIGARKLVEDGHQYHLRVYEDKRLKEFRLYCHWEWMPEVRPLEHYLGEGYEKDCSQLIIFRNWGEE